MCVKSALGGHASEDDIRALSLRWNYMVLKVGDEELLTRSQHTKMVRVTIGLKVTPEI